MPGREQGQNAQAPRGSRASYGQALCLFMIFLLLWIPAAMRQETGNDYMRYVEFFHLANVHAYVPTEPGFNAVVRVIYGLCGYENYLLVFALFSFATIALFLAALWQQAKMGEERFFAASFFLFMTFGYYFQTYNTVRYYLALAVSFYALRFFLQRQYVTFLVLILLAALFHKSVLVVLVLYPMAAFAWKKWMVVLLTVLGAGFILFQDLCMKIIVWLYPSYLDTDILAAGGSPSYVNILRCAAILMLCGLVAFWNRGNPEHSFGVCYKESRSYRFYRNAVWISLWIYIFAYFVPELSRICYYLTVTQVILIPQLILEVPQNRKREKKVLTILIAAAAVLFFLLFLKTAYKDTIRILPYHSFLFDELSLTPSRSIIR